MVVGVILLMLLILPAIGWVAGVCSHGFRRTRWVPVVVFYGVTLGLTGVSVVYGELASTLALYLVALLGSPFVTAIAAFSPLPRERREHGFEVVPVQDQPAESRE